VWFPVRQPDETFRLTHIRDFPPQPDAIRLLAPSLRDKGFLALGDGGMLGLYYSTSKRVLWTGDSPIPDATAMFYTPKADGAYLANADRLSALNIDNPHPEVGFRAMFGKTWYEGYQKPEHVWQSTGGTDEFEPKLSLTPLMIGTLKGTIYSLFLAIPLGVLGAMYTSQFMHPALRRYIKPAVEIMAALPSVVLGFLAGLWLAPRIEDVVPALFAMLIVLPIMVLIAGEGWRALPVTFRNRFFDGTESVLSMFVVAPGIWLCISANGRV
jgi:phosphate transport system permease protein